MTPSSSLRNLYTAWRIYRRNQRGTKFEPETPYMQYMCNAGDTCLHFGASDGRHSYLLSSIVGATGQVHAYEPSNYSFAVMSRLIRWHGLVNVTPHNAAIGSQVGQVTLNVPTKTSGHLGRAYAVIGEDARGSEELLAKQNSTKFERQVASVTTLDQIKEDLGVARIHFIRCDIEGAEAEMIKGGKSTIEVDLPAMLIEIHPFSVRQNFKTDPDDIKDYFLQLGYKMWRLDDEDEKLIAVTELDQKRRWRDYFLIHPTNAARLPDGPFKHA